MRQSQQAFTLIELMVVMAIMTVMFSLIGPLAQNQVDKVRASEEWYSFSQQIKSLPQTVFLTGQPASVNLKDSQMTIVQGDKVLQTTLYKQLHFKQQQIRFNRHGYPDTSSVEVRVRQMAKSLPLLSNQEKIAGLMP